MRKDIVFLCFVVLLNCQQNNKNEHVQKNSAGDVNVLCNDLDTFNNVDSTGTVRGIIQAVEDTSSMAGCVLIVLKDKNLVERVFCASYGIVKGLEIKKLTSGVCVTVTYYAEIQREEGVEVNRTFYITKLDYR